MGLLDDAIREHLELKRRRGADAGEVARQEEEALGDPRAPQPDAGPGPDEPGAPEDEASESGFEHDLEDERAAADERLPGDPLTDEAPPAGPYDAVAVKDEDEPWLADDELEDRRREPEPEPEPPTAEQEAAPREPGAADEDVLEDTPDFLQDTPEHDRLWFEQRPPRDFDFDS